MTKEELIKRLETTCFGLDPIDPLRLLVDDVIEALREHAMYEVQRLGQEIEQEPVTYWKEHAQGLQRDYDSLLADFQAQRTWVGLTEDEIDAIYTGVRAVHHEIDSDVFAKAIEARLKEKNSA